jgi:hypothetical protein
MQNFEKYMQTKHKGKSNAVFSKELERVFRCKGTEIRRMVNELRTKGVPICSCSRGYYYAENASDIQETIAHLDGRMSKIKAAQGGLRGILNNYTGG